MKFPSSFITAALFVSLVVSCSKRQVPPTAQAARVTALGTVGISDGVPSRHDMDDGKVCIIKPSVLKDGTIKLSMTIEGTNSAGIKQETVLQVQCWPDQPVEIESGGVGVSLTPHIKQ
jgi:hypothetical protein